MFGSVPLGRASLACLGCPCFGWPLPVRFSCGFLPWRCGAPLFRCCCWVVLVWLSSPFLFALVAWVLAVGPLSPGFPPFPPPLVVFWCFLVQSVLLVPPSGYLVVFATVRLSYLRRPCGVVGRATFLTSRTDYRWRFDSPLVRRYASKCGDQAKANWRRPQEKGPVVIPLAWRVVADWLLSSLRFMATKASALCGALPSPPCCGCCTCAPRCGTEVFALG